MSVATLPAPQTTRHEDGTETIVLYRLNDAGKKVKVTRRVRVESIPASTTEERRNWPRYGEAAQAGDYQPTYDDDIALRLYPKSTVPQKETQREKKTGQRMKCHFCRGDHFTHACPLRDKLANVQELNTPPPMAQSAAAQGKYVPPALRSGFAGGPPGVPMMMQSQQERDEASTLRVSNLPEDISEPDLRKIFSFNERVRIMRCNVVRNKITGRGRGFAFIAFEDPTVAEQVRQFFDGKAVNNLIMHVDFANAGRR